MGLQGPLTAQALGRSPYDDVVPGEVNQDDGQPSSQQYDHRGRPVNPRSKQINRDIIRAHNEVMLVVGVAEPENPHSATELESKRQHDAYETTLGFRLIWATKRCVEMVGVFGVNGLRQRILVYNRYSRTPCWELYQAMRKDFSVTRSMLPGAPASLLGNYLDRRFGPQWFLRNSRPFIGKCIDYAWTYTCIHLEMYATYQRLGLIRSTLLLPSWRFFVPFTDQSPIPAPPPLEDFTFHSLLKWAGGVAISAAPFLVCAMTRRLMKEWQFYIWQASLSHLPNPIVGGRDILPLCPELPDPPEDAPQPPDAQNISETEGVHGQSDGTDQDSTPQSSSEASSPPVPQPEVSRSQGVTSVTGGDDYGSEDDDNEVVSATLISFDVEATEATEVPQGMWSAELRPSAGPDSRQSSTPTYLSTMLTRMPSLMAAKIVTDSAVRLFIAPCEAMALRFTARAFCLRHGLPCSHIFSLDLLSGFNMTWLANFLGTEFFHLSLSVEFWSLFSGLAQHLHKSEQEWEDFGGKEWGDWLGPFHTFEPLF